MTNKEAASHLRLILDEGLAGDANYDDKGKDAEAVRLAITALCIAARSPAPGAVAMREAAAKVAENPYSDAVEAFGPDEPMAVGAKIAAAIRALPIPAPEVPEVPWPVRAYAEWLDDCRNALDDNDVPMKNLRSWIMEEYGI